MKESVLSIDNHDTQLIGVLTEEDEYQGSAQKPIVILINSGLLSRTGPFRLHVTLARELAKIGFNTFRLDLSGIGDSERHRGKKNIGEQHVNDIREVMDFLANEKGERRFVVMGICTGADNSHKVAAADDRVVGAICIDGPSYKTMQYYINHYLPRITRLTVWINFLKRVFGKSQKQKEPDDIQEFKYRWVRPPKEKTRIDLQNFINRDLRLLYIYSSMPGYNYTNQLADAFSSLDFGKSISMAYHGDAEHTFPILEDRDNLVNTIRQWLQSNF